MVADPQSGVQSGVARKVCRHFHILTRHRKGRLGGVVLVRGQEGVCFLFLTAYLHRPAGEVLSLRRNGCQVHGFTHRHSAAARYGRIAAFNGRRHMVADPQSGVQSGVARKVCLYFHVLSRHGKGRLGGVVLVLGQEVVCFLFLIAYHHRPADEVLSIRHSGCQVHFGVCGHRGIQHFVLKFCGNILTGSHSVQRTHITACIAVLVFCIVVNMGGFRHLFSRQARAVCSSALPPVFGTVMLPLVIMPMHIQVKGSTAGMGGAAGIVLISNRSAARGNFQFGSVQLAIRPVTGLADIKTSRQLTQVVDAICIHGNLVMVVVCINISNRRHYHFFIETQRGQFIIVAPQISPPCVLTYIQLCQLVFIAFHGAHC